MKIVCNNCSTKYSVADEKVAGKVFRTPCKRCGSTMIIEGTGAVSREQNLLAERHENSVLFSLNNLASLADPPPARNRPEATRTEGSGLLDIRRMASAYLSEKTETTAEFDGFATMTPTTPLVFAQPIAASRANSKSPLLWLVGGATGMAAIAAIAVSLVLFKTSEKANAQASPVVAVAETPVSASPTPAPITVPQPVVEPEPVKPEPVKPEPTSQPKPEKPATKEPARTRHPRNPRVAEKPEQPESPKKGCLDEVGCLLAADPPPCCRKYTESEPSPAPSTKKPDVSLPLKLERQDITDGMKDVSGRIAACSGRSAVSGKVTVSVEVAGNGKVQSVSITESPDDALGTCVAQAAKKASFPKTQQGGKFKYPYVFR